MFKLSEKQWEALLLRNSHNGVLRDAPPGAGAGAGAGPGAEPVEAVAEPVEADEDLRVVPTQGLEGVRIVCAPSGGESAASRLRSTRPPAPARPNSVRRRPSAADRDRDRDRNKGSTQHGFVHLLFLEADAPNPTWTWVERTVDYVIQHLQPAPSLTHAELLMNKTKDDEESTFATYMGRTANYGSAFGNSREFYLDPNANGSSWRAVPILARDALERVRSECSRHVGTGYGSMLRLFDYPFAVPPLRALSWLLDDEVKTPGHCATVSVRILRRALPELEIPQCSKWYGPSTLFLELNRKSRAQAYERQLEQQATVRSLAETEAALAAVETLLRGADDEVAVLSFDDAQLGYDLLSSKAVEATASGDVTLERQLQMQLARALLRGSLLHASAAEGDDEATQPMGEAVQHRGAFR